MGRDVLSFSVAALQQLYRAGEVSPVEVMDAVLARVARFNPSLNAFAWLAEEKALMREAVAAEKRFHAGAPRGPLDGVPVTVKDFYHVRGWPTRYGSLISPDDRPQEADAPLVAALRDAGAVFLGKTTLPEYGHTGTTQCALTGVTRNPWDRRKTAGGSSGGAAVAAGMGLLHVGSDAGGSIRIPASFCGVFGFKPSPGLVPHWPPGPFSSLSSAGPLARGVEDAAVMLDALARYDARDCNALPGERGSFHAAVQKPPEKPRIAFAPTISGAHVEPGVAAAVRAAVEKLRALGPVEEITLDIPELVETFETHWKAVAAWMTGKILPHARGRMDRNLLWWAEQGEGVSCADYIDAGQRRMMIAARMRALLEEYDILLLPATAVAAFDAGRYMPDDAEGRPWRGWALMTYPANLARLPAASIPCGATPEGMPVGLQAVAGFLRDELLMRFCFAAEGEMGAAPPVHENAPSPFRLHRAL